MSGKADDVIKSIRKRFQYNFRQEGTKTLPTDGGAPGFNACREYIRNFSKIDHFVIELIQNAEDCNSNSFKLIIEKDKIIVTNDGDQFTEADVRSLCSFGEGTKKDKPDYIGFFGAGFKSVFRITDNPKIFSGEYNFQFDNNSFWVPTICNEKKPYPSKGTTIVLPLKADLSNEKISEIEKQIFSLKAEVILFLKKLQKIHIINKVNGDEVILHKKKVGNIIELYNKKVHCGNWAIFDEKFTIDSSALASLDKDEREKRKNARIRSVYIAFKLDKENNFVKDIGSENLYAFLPTKYSTRVRFLINSDFITTAGRERLFEDSKWNKWLFSCAGDVLIKAINEFKSDSTLKYSFYEVLPKYFEVKDDILVINLYQKLEKYCREDKIALTIKDDWVKLDKVSYVVPSDKEILQLLSNEEFNKLKGKQYLNPNIKGRDFLEGFGLNIFTAEDFLEILKERKWIEKKSDEWFLELYMFLFNKYRENEVQKKMVDLPILKLDNGKIKSISEIKVDFPSKSIYYPSDEIKIDKEVKDLLNNEIGFLNKSIYNLYQKKYSHLNTFFKYSLQRDIKDLDLNNIILDLVSANFKDVEDSQKSKLLGLTEYIRGNLSKLDNETIEEIGKAIKLLTKDGLWVLPNEIYISKEYLDTDIFDVIHQHVPFNVVSKDYLSQSKNKESWLKFFKELQVNFYFKCERRDRWHNGIDHGHDDVDCNIIQKLFGSLKDKNNQYKIEIFKKLFGALDKNWSYYKEKLTISQQITVIKNCKEDHWENQTHPTLFLNILRGKRWIPTSNGDLCFPEEAYLDTKEIKEYDENLPRLNVGYSVKNRELTRALGINENLDAEAYINDLESMKNLGKIDLKLIDKRYSLIAESLSTSIRKEKIEQVIDKFRKNQLLYQPILKGRDHKWSTSDECFLSHTGLIKDYIFGLNNIYVEKGSGRLFSEFLKIRQEPAINHYIQALDILQSEKLSEKNKSDILKIYMLINDTLKGGETESLDWWDSFFSGKYFFSQKGNFCEREELLLDDNYGFGCHFEKELEFLYVPDERVGIKISELISKLNLKKISQEIKRELKRTQVVKKIPLSRLIPNIDIYDKAIKNYIASKYREMFNEQKSISDIEVIFAKDLQAKYTLKGIAKDVGLSFYLNKNSIYLKHKNSINVNEYKEELSKSIAEYYGAPLISEHLFKLIQLCIIDKGDIFEFYKKESIRLSKGEYQFQESDKESEEARISEKESQKIQKGALASDIKRKKLDKEEFEDFIESATPIPEKKEEKIKEEKEPSEDLHKKYLELLKQRREEKRKEEELLKKEKEIEAERNAISEQKKSMQEEKKKLNKEKGKIQDIEQELKRARTQSPTRNTLFDKALRKLGVKKAPYYDGAGITSINDNYSIEEKEEIEAKFSEELNKEIAEVRSANVKRQYKQILESLGDNKVVNQEVKDYYRGKCQICDFTFKERTGRNYCEITDILPKRYKGARFVGNKLCLCPNHSAMIKHASPDYDLERASKDRLAVTINGKKHIIKFTPLHFIAFKVMFRKK